MSKITKLLLIIAIALLAFYCFLIGYLRETEDIASKIGAKVGGGELSTADYYSLAQCIQTYNQYLIQKDYASAYRMLNMSFRNYETLEAYEEQVAKRTNAKMRVTNITPITTALYRVTTDVSGETVLYSILVENEKNAFAIFPQSFLDYQEIKEKHSQNGMQCQLENYVVKTNQIELNFTVENKSQQSIAIVQGQLLTHEGEIISLPINRTFLPKTKEDVTVVFETDYAFPKQITLQWEKENAQKGELVFLSQK